MRYFCFKAKASSTKSWLFICLLYRVDSNKWTFIQITFILSARYGYEAKGNAIFLSALLQKIHYPWGEDSRGMYNWLCSIYSNVLVLARINVCVWECKYWISNKKADERVDSKKRIGNSERSIHVGHTNWKW